MKRYGYSTLLGALILLCLQSCGILLDLTPSGIGSIGFWGRIIDQYGNPVQGADILSHGGQGYLGGGRGYLWHKTDEEGFFNIRDMRGGALNLRKMTKEGYQIVVRSVDNNFSSGSPTALDWRDYKKDNPYIFHAWKISENFTNRKSLNNSLLDIGFSADGEEYTVDLDGGTNQDYKKEFSKAEFTIKYFVEAGATHNTNKNWKLLITSKDGGVQKATSIYTNEAPREGYSETITYTQEDYPGSYPKSNPAQEVRTFYFTIKGGKLYGRMSFRLSTTHGDKRIGGALFTRYTINTAGEIYLDTFDGWSSRD